LLVSGAGQHREPLRGEGVETERMIPCEYQTRLSPGDALALAGFRRSLPAVVPQTRGGFRRRQSVLPRVRPTIDVWSSFPPG
jgi:hypothetical protein